MTNINLEGMTRAELLALKKDVATALQDYDARMKAKAREKIKAELEARGFKLSDLFAIQGRKSKAPAKYANPADHSQTWNGMGRKPKWLLEQLSQGKTLEDVAI
ncbi:H-NS histone family protein [Rhodobacteraceae bacterium R_SAG4]|nr:H-NS histone family protein [Rhodobacteraceae bacterium R_SAG4]